MYSYRLQDPHNLYLLRMAHQLLPAFLNSSFHYTPHNLIFIKIVNKYYYFFGTMYCMVLFFYYIFVFLCFLFQIVVIN